MGRAELIIVRNKYGLTKGGRDWQPGFQRRGLRKVHPGSGPSGSADAVVMMVRDRIQAPIRHRKTRGEFLSYSCLTFDDYVLFEFRSFLFTLPGECLLVDLRTETRW